MERRPDSVEPMVRGWCPGAWRPMMAGDGLLVRVRPALSRLTRVQALGLCRAADTYGNGAIDLTNRAGLQIRGVTEDGLPGLLDSLLALHLIAADGGAEARPAITVAPDWLPGDDTERLARQLDSRLGELPELPGKMGFAIDLTGAPVLSDISADFRLEREGDGGLIVRADGRKSGLSVTLDGAVDGLLELAHWFAQSGGPDAGRMARHHAELPERLAGGAVPAAPRMIAGEGHGPGSILGAPFGRMVAADLTALLDASAATALRITPWRRIILENVFGVTEANGFIIDPDDAVLRTDACVGAPACPQATVETRDFALHLAGQMPGSLHISGCAKGCARPIPADVVLTGRNGRFDIAFHARAGDPATYAELSARDLSLLLGMA